MQNGKLFRSVSCRTLELNHGHIITPPKIQQNAPQDDPTSLMPKKLGRARPLFDPEIVGGRPGSLSSS